MDENKEPQISPNEEQLETEPIKEPEGEPKVEDKPSSIPYYRFKEKVDETKTLKEELERAIAEKSKYDGMDIEELQELKKLQQDLKTNPGLLPYMKQKVSEYYAEKRTPTNTTIIPDRKIIDLEKRMEQFEIDKLTARIEDNLGKLEQEFGKYDKEKLLTLVEEDGLNPTSIRHMKMAFKEYFSDTISTKKKSDLEEQIKKLPEGGGLGGKPTSTSPDSMADFYRLAKEGKTK